VSPPPSRFRVVGQVTDQRVGDRIERESDTERHTGEARIQSEHLAVVKKSKVVGVFDYAVGNSSATIDPAGDRGDLQRHGASSSCDGTSNGKLCRGGSLQAAGSELHPKASRLVRGMHRIHVSPCRNAAQCSGRQHSLGLVQAGARRGVLGASGRRSFYRVRRGGASRAVPGGSSAISCGDFSAPPAASSATDAGSRGMRSGQKGLELEECASLAIESIGLTRVPTGVSSRRHPPRI
jgi:hypothetical protein